MTATLQPDPARRGILKMLAAGVAAPFIPSDHGVLMPVREIASPIRGMLESYQPIDQDLYLVVTNHMAGVLGLRDGGPVPGFPGVKVVVSDYLPEQNHG